MEENYIRGQTGASNFSFTLDPFIATPSTILSPPMENSIPSSQNTLPQTFNPTYHQLLMGNHQSLCNQFSTRNQIPITSNSSNTPLILFESPSLSGNNNRYMYNLQMEPSFRPIALSTNLTLGNQAMYNVGYGHSAPYLANTSPNYFDFDVSWNPRYPSLIKEPSRVYRCATCRVEFPTAQAYGGHMSSHSKARKAQDKLEATEREAKRARIAKETYPFFDLSKRPNMSLIAKKTKEEITKEGDVSGKGKNIMRLPDKEAEEIQMEIPGYNSDESVNSEFFLQLKP
ncbi:uncharacterized protein A4U43_C01F33480 [Asparagus officinalis]|uniref:C2H2-type domain-containing protein n=1 Tax=Asparagus officinalis TaxID=4686 RepID=A0A5P1FW85_ASPOF|nr:uncharacterized protein A4U43_C01F33480 [Asparagus officinalis]